MKVGVRDAEHTHAHTGQPGGCRGEACPEFWVLLVGFLPGRTQAEGSGLHPPLIRDLAPRPFLATCCAPERATFTVGFHFPQTQVAAAATPRAAGIAFRENDLDQKIG